MSFLYLVYRYSAICCLYVIFKVSIIARHYVSAVYARAKCLSCHVSHVVIYIKGVRTFRQQMLRRQCWTFC